MDAEKFEDDYPRHLIGHEPPPPYANEGPHELWHFSEDPDLSRFDPHVAKSSSESDALVWAIDTRHAPAFWFPRDCPRGCAWVVSTTTTEDRIRYLGHSAATRVHVIESAWADRMRECTLYAYRFPPEPFEFHGDGTAGYWSARETVYAVDRVEVGDLIQRHADAEIELRITPDIWPFWHSVIYSSLEFSGSRLRNTTVPQPPVTYRGLMYPGPG